MRKILPVALLGILISASLGAHEIERWLRTHPKEEPEIRHDRIGGQPPNGPVFRWFLESSSNRLQAFCRKYLADREPLPETEVPLSPSLSEITLLQEELLEAAVVASATLPEAEASPTVAVPEPASASAAQEAPSPAGGGSIPPEAQPTAASQAAAVASGVATPGVAAPGAAAPGK